MIQKKTVNAVFFVEKKGKETMDEILRVLPNETEDECLFRIGEAKRDGLLDLTWTEIAEFFNKEFRSDETEYRTESSYRKKFKNYIDAKDMLTKSKFTESGFEDQYKELEVKKRELQKEKVKVQTEKLEYNRWLREEAREELIVEHIVNAIKGLQPLKVPEIIIPTHNNRSASLVIADAHYGKELHINGLFGETLNEYSPEIFEQRMWDLLGQTINICEKEGFDTLNVYDLGDEIDGMLRVSALMKLRYGVLESAVRYGNFITVWLNELSEHVRIRYQMVKDSNHCQLRLLGQPKNTFKDENVSVIITDKIIDRLSENNNFEFVQNPTGYIFDQVSGYNVFGYHGEGKRMEQAIKDFSKAYKTQIDFMIGGHNHHKESGNVGIESDVISIPSIIGIDDYSMSLNKTSDPGALLFVLEEGRGNVIEYNIKL